MRITPSNHAYSTSKLAAIMTKFWSITISVTPKMRAKVTVVVAMMIHARFFINSSVRNRLGTTKRMTEKFSREAITA